MAHRLISCYRPDDLQLQRLPSVHVAYGNSKLENIMTAGELHRRYHGQGLSAASFHPGVVASHFASDARSPMRLIYGTGLRRLLRMVSVEEGADTLTWLADGQPGGTSPGGYYYRRAPERTARKARDQALAGRLWEDNLRLLAPWLDGRRPAEARHGGRRAQAALLALALWFGASALGALRCPAYGGGPAGLRLLTPEALGGVAAAWPCGGPALSLLTGAGEAEPGLMTLWDLVGGKPLPG